MLFGLILRAYAPFRRFGGVYKGDGRGATTSSSVTSRVKTWVTFDPVTGGVGKPSEKSDTSHFAVGPSWTAVGIPIGRVSAVKVGRNAVYFQLHSSGSNPLFPGAPPIDMHVAITASLDANRLNVAATLTGDAFPNAEVILMDEVGNRQMLFTFETTGGADTGPLRLMGDSKKPMNAISKAFSLDAEGHFEGSEPMCSSGVEVR
jgi:hypothetical protein